MVGFILYGCVSSAQGYIGRAIVAKVSNYTRKLFIFSLSCAVPPTLPAAHSTIFILFFSSFHIQGLGKGRGMYPVPYAH